MSLRVACTGAFVGATRPGDEHPSNPTVAAQNRTAVSAFHIPLAPMVLIVSGTPQRAPRERTDMVAPSLR